jgi:hypothetical protein
MLQEWLNRLFLLPRASVASMTNWPSSCDRGAYQLQIGSTMTPREKMSPDQEKNNTVTDEIILKMAKEIAVKFIEAGRVTPATFETTFKNIYATIDNTVRKG